METRKGGRLIDRPEFKTKPQPVTFLGKDKVFKAIEVMEAAESVRPRQNLNQDWTPLNIYRCMTCTLIIIK